ncbi:GGDEF domain-containing protein [Marinomonas flavescens]|uniref:GGDEF domain-containing protein n=1 Tax=Marinomonas flavescens TaxID=2529379 RepID=UPI001055F229|nr:GGDEF domain-containing protein [Marinomonas flavescens]
MPPTKPHWLDKLLNFGVSEGSASSLTYQQVVNLTLALLCVTDFMLMLIFSAHGSFLVVAFYFLALILSLSGFYLQSKGLLTFVRVLTPFNIITQIVVSNLLFFGAYSDFHWLLVTISAYAFAGFKPGEKALRYGVIALSILLFIVCELFPAHSAFLSVNEQKVSSVLTFLWTLITIAVVINVVVARLRQANNHLRILAEKDELTGLANRRKILLSAVSIYAEAQQLGKSCVFAILDLDHFKYINDNFGHEAGDVVLSKVASVMHSCLTPGDEIGRYGGEEFVVIMKNTTLKEAEVKMNDLRQSVENAMIVTDKSIVIPVTVSIGLAVISSQTKRYEDVLALADIALYQAKEIGRNRVISQASTL